MIKLKDIIKEFDYGKHLFARSQDDDWWDANDAGENEFTDRLDKKYPKKKYGDHMDEFEPNTPAELKFLKFIEEFIESGHNMTTSGVGTHAILKKLLTLKSKFPEILDPNESSFFAGGPNVYRGATIQRDDIKKNGITKDMWGPPELPNVSDRSDPPMLTCKEGKYTVNTQSERGFVSFSHDASVAFHFMTNTENNDPSGKRIDAILTVPIDSDRLLFNPMFLYQIISHFEEYESWYVPKGSNDDIICSQLSITEEDYRMIYQ